MKEKLNDPSLSVGWGEYVIDFLMLFNCLDMSVSYESCPNLSYDVRVGRNQLKLCCPVSGYPKPFITWERNGVQLQKSENPLYIIPEVKQEDFGNYTCTAADGKSFIASAVTVRDKIGE